MTEMRLYHPAVSAPGSSAPGRVTVVKESAAFRDGFWGALTAVCVAPAVLNYLNADTTAGRVVGTVVFSVLAVLVMMGWYRVRRAPTRLEISDDAVTQFNATPTGPTALLRSQGDELMFVTRGGARFRYVVLTARGSDTELPLRYFSRRAIERACRAHGWSFTTASATRGR
jgi:hypothetical protein